MRATRCSVFTPRARVVGKEIFAKWKALGLASEPNVGDNGMHASASPFEAMAERLNWVGAKLEEDAFGKAMLQAGIPRATIMEWTKDPQVAFEGKKQSLFDLLEDLDYADCLAKAQKIAGVSGSVPAGKSQAFVFVKPHAVTDPVKALAKEKLAAAGITIAAEGALAGPQIAKDLLIDNHYVRPDASPPPPRPAAAAAPRPHRLRLPAPRSSPPRLPLPPRRSTPSQTRPPSPSQPTSTRPRQSSCSSPTSSGSRGKRRRAGRGRAGRGALASPAPPRRPQALSDGVVYNAVDACERLGVDGDQMDKLWANAKKSDNLVKFGGGFYAGKIPAPMPSPKKKKGLITRTSGDMSVFSSGESVLDAVFGPEGGKML